MKNIKEAFNYSFEQVGHNQEPEFQIHGIGHRGKWGKDTMAIFIKDLESLSDLKVIKEQESDIRSLREKVGELKGEIEELKKELDEQ